jgi:hypothetical protein
LLSLHQNKDVIKSKKLKVFCEELLLKSSLSNLFIRLLIINISFTKSFVEVDFGFHAFEHFFGSISSKRSMTRNHLKQQNSKSPNINFIIIRLVLIDVNHFRGHVFVSSTKSLTFSQDSCKAKITQFSLFFRSKQNIFGLHITIYYLYVSMHDLFTMEIRNSLTYISEVFPNLFFWQTVIESGVFYFLEKSSSIRILQDHVCDLSLLINERTK